MQLKETYKDYERLTETGYELSHNEIYYKFSGLKKKKL